MADAPQIPSVTLVVPQLVPRYGMEQAALDLLAALQGHVSIRVVALSGDVPSGLFGATGQSLRLANGVGRLPRSLAPLRRLLAERPGDVVIASGLWAAVPVLAVSRGRRVVIWEHTLMAARLRETAKVRLLVAAARRLYPRAEAAVGVSTSTAEALCVLMGPEASRVRVIPNVARPTAPKLTAKPDSCELSLLSIGSLSPRKNHALAIRALLHLPRAKLIICGEGPERQNLESLIHELDLSDRVTLLGYRDDVDELRQHCDVIVHPSLAETFGLAVTEAAEAGRPVVALDRAPINELVPALCPGVLSSEDPGEFAAGVESAASLLADSRAFATASQRRRQSMGPDVVRDAWLEVLCA